MKLHLNTGSYTKSVQANSQTKPKEAAQERRILSDRMEVGKDKMYISEEARKAIVQTLEVSVPSGSTNAESEEILADIKKLAQYADEAEAHYAQVNEENKRFDNPLQHIERKYYDRFYPYYVEGLTNVEREICVQNERNAYEGDPIKVSFYDPAVQKAIATLDPKEDAAAQRLVERYENYQEERKKTLEKEKTEPNHYDLFRWNSIQVIPEGTTKTPEELLAEERVLESAMYYHYFLTRNAAEEEE